MIEKMTYYKIGSMKGRKPLLQLLTIGSSGYTSDINFQPFRLSIDINYSVLSEYSVYFTRTHSTRVYVVSDDNIYYVGDFDEFVGSGIFRDMFLKLSTKELTALEIFEFLEL